MGGGRTTDLCEVLEALAEANVARFECADLVVDEDPAHTPAGHHEFLRQPAWRA
jgi:hypothetical protein